MIKLGIGLSDMSNFEHISCNRYRVLNQNGYKNALYHYFSQNHNFTKKRIREMVENYLTVYPCEIYIIDLTFECSRIFVESPDGEVNTHCPWVDENHIYRNIRK